MSGRTVNYRPVFSGGGGEGTSGGEGEGGGKMGEEKVRGRQRREIKAPSPGMTQCVSECECGHTQMPVLLADSD